MPVEDYLGARPDHKLEFLALKWAVTEKFCDYLYGSSIKVVTDSNPLGQVGCNKL